MHKIFDTYIPEGFHTVSSYLMVDNAEKFIDFLKNAFYAEEESRTIGEKGVIRNCILAIGNTKLMVAQGRGDFIDMRTSFYLYVNDVDSMHQRALDHGAEEVFAPMEMDYGDYQGGVKDMAGNYWWISMRMEEKPYSS